MGSGKPPVGLKNRKEIGGKMTGGRMFWTEDRAGWGAVL